MLNHLYIVLAIVEVLVLEVAITIALFLLSWLVTLQWFNATEPFIDKATGLILCHRLFFRIAVTYYKQPCWPCSLSEVEPRPAESPLLLAFFSVSNVSVYENYEKRKAS